MSVMQELRGVADSPFSKEKADLVILAVADSSGVPVADRMLDIREEHREADYRLIPRDTLVRAVRAFEQMQQGNRDMLAMLTEFMGKVGKDLWPERLRETAELFDSVGGSEQH